MVVPPRFDSVLRQLRKLASAASSPSATLLIAAAFLVVPVKVALSLAQKTKADPVRSGFASCAFKHKIVAGDSLESLSSFYFGEAGYGWTILLATNMKAGSLPFKFVKTPFDLPVGQTLCIPTNQDADGLKQRYDTYLRAGHAAMLVEPTDPSHSLVALKPGETVRLVTWIRQDTVAAYQGAKKKQMPGETWVTVAPNLQTFCQAYVEEHDPDPAELTLRLEQRLGLPPGSSNVAMVEFSLTVPATSSTDVIFRPCGDPQTEKEACLPQTPPAGEEFGRALGGVGGAGGAGGAKAQADFRRWYWFLSKYYSSYGVASPYQYPWTASGYTFDWAPHADDDQRFAKWGESEFVVARGAAIEVLAIEDTVTFCTPNRRAQ